MVRSLLLGSIGNTSVLLFGLDEVTERVFIREAECVSVMTEADPKVLV